jgi:hypothetical protein
MYERACNERADPKTRPTTITDHEINTVDFWPTRVNSYSSCNEAAVRLFFAKRSLAFNRKEMFEQAKLWHPDRAVTVFGGAKDEESVFRTVTMIQQVINDMIATLWMYLGRWYLGRSCQGHDRPWQVVSRSVYGSETNWRLFLSWRSGEL